MLHSVLVANRGEIACRILRTCKRLGIQSLLLVDPRDGAHAALALADQTLEVSSHLCASEIVRLARKHKVQALHPGYGFLAENAHFAAQVERAGINFIGPKAATIRALGDKLKARALAQRLGVPLSAGCLIPGKLGAAALKRLQREAQRIGYPVLVKASAGGGGKGMRKVSSAEELQQACESAAREALAAFGDSTLFLEKMLPTSSPGIRHIEVQVLGDGSGAIALFGDRDCSLQRRHQKVLEEAPAPALPERVRTALHDYAFQLCSSVRYRSAGTVEFLYQEATQQLSFLEVNSRLQVEHPVSELVTGYDLVELQLRIAAAEPLSSLLPAQYQAPANSRFWSLPSCGHAVEVRLCAEDPRNDLVPISGTLQILSLGDRQLPQRPSDLRVDSGYLASDQVTHHFDSLIAKLIAHGATREQAFSNLSLLLEDCNLAGLSSNLPLLRALSHSARATGLPFSLSSLSSDYPRLPELAPLELQAAALILLLPLLRQRAAGPARSCFERLEFWQLGMPTRFERRVLVNAKALSVSLEAQLAGAFVARALAPQNEPSPTKLEVRFEALQLAATSAANCYQLTWEQDKQQRIALVLCQPELSWVALEGESLCVSTQAWQGTEAIAGASDKISAPFPGRIVRVFVSEGQVVAAKSPLLAFESMKMEHIVRAPRAGQVAKILVKQEQVVSAQQELLKLE